MTHHTTKAFRATPLITLLLLALCVSVSAQSGTRTTEQPPPSKTFPTTGLMSVTREGVVEETPAPVKPPIIISADRSAQLRAQADAAQREARLAEALRRVALLEAVLEAVGVDLSKYEASADAEGRIVLTPKKEEKEKK